MKPVKVVLAILGLAAVVVGGHAAVRAAFPKASCCASGSCGTGGACCKK